MIFFFAAFLLPFLTDFGLMELLGTFLRKVFRRVFRLPGRSAIDAMASWLAAAAVGILITSQQYESGFYSRREASVIATNFSIVSIPFALLIANTIGIGHLFFPYYATVGVAGLVCAWVVPRLPPLKSIPDSYFEGVGKKISEDVPDDVSLFRWGWRQATERAERAPGPKALARNSAANVLDIWFSLTPGVIAVGGLGLMIAEYTPVMRYLSYPLVPVLELLRIPEAAAAAPALLVGFLEMFLPAVIASGIESELTRFVVACMSIVQLIYMSEVGILFVEVADPATFERSRGHLPRADRGCVAGGCRYRALRRVLTRTTLLVIGNETLELRAKVLDENQMRWWRSSSDLFDGDEALAVGSDVVHLHAEPRDKRLSVEQHGGFGQIQHLPALIHVNGH